MLSRPIRRSSNRNYLKTAPVFTTTILTKNSIANAGNLEPKKWKVKDGVLIGVPDFTNAEEAQKALGRDHHFGLGPVIRFNKLPEKFLLQKRFKFEGETYMPARPNLRLATTSTIFCLRKTATPSNYPWRTVRTN